MTNKYLPPLQQDFKAMYREMEPPKQSTREVSWPLLQKLFCKSMLSLHTNKTDSSRAVMTPRKLEIEKFAENFIFP